METERGCQKPAVQQKTTDGDAKVSVDNRVPAFRTLLDVTKGALHKLNQMVNLMANHLVKCRHVARDTNPRLKLT